MPVVNSVLKEELRVKEEIKEENEQFVDQVLHIVIHLFIITSIYCYNEQHCCYSVSYTHLPHVVYNYHMDTIIS